MISAVDVSEAHDTLPDTDTDRAGVGSGVYEDSLTRTYSIGPGCEPIVSPGGLTSTADVYEIPAYTNRPWGAGKCPNPAEFSAYYGVYTTLMPFQWLEEDAGEDRLATMATVQEYLNSRPPTRERVSQGSLRSSNVLDDQRHSVPISDMCLLSGWWPGTSKPSNGVHYFNPGYCHSHDSEYCLTEPAERLAMAHWAAALHLTAGDLVPMFGVTDKSTTRQYICRRGVDWGRLRRAGRRRLARTIKTIRAWGRKWSMIAAAFGRPETTLMTWVDTYASEYTPPPDPSVAWFEAPLMEWVSERRDRGAVSCGHVDWIDRLNDVAEGGVTG